MGTCGDKCAAEYKFSREEQDDYAKESFRRALAAQAAKKEGVHGEIEPVKVPSKKGEPVLVHVDEGPGKGDASKFASLKPAFSKDGTITAANASSISDGASALILASEMAVRDHKLEPLARIVGYGGAAQAPERFTTAPAKAIETTLAKLGMKTEDIDLYEINEAFAVVAMACSRLCGIDLQRVNVRGGAVALGHPIGATGARILTTLLYAMQERSAKRGLATLCIGGGEALAVVLER
jgi:acetyl-CoA C-acetyltransferase